jgi:EAL domain-containing protein (putative c-di-GMP-specific phosphodiesterase class I)
MMGWLESGLQAATVAVNLSSAQFHGTDLLKGVVEILNETTLPPNYLALEVTESMIMHDSREACNILCCLSDLGVRISLDDFGTGHSTLSLLRDLPVHQLKIDQAFVKDLAVNAKDVALVRAIIAMAHSLDLTVIAEGVESEEQLAILREEECDEVQGYLTGQPLPADQLAALLDRTHSEKAGEDEPQLLNQAP